MLDKRKHHPEDYMSDMDLDDMEMYEMDMPMMGCPMMQCPMLQCPMMQYPMMQYMGNPMHMEKPKMMHKGSYDKWDLEDIYEEDDDSDYSSDDKESHGWCPHPYYKRK